jgi:hypothetical protein
MTPLQEAGSGEPPDAPPAPDSLWVVDFTAITPGNVHTLAALEPRLGLSRASTATVQTSASTIVSTVGVNEARVGSPGAGVQGLVIEEARTNSVLNSRNCSNDIIQLQNGGAVDAGTIIANCSQSPDQTLSASCIDLPSGEYAKQVVEPATGDNVIASLWALGTPVQWAFGSHIAGNACSFIPSVTAWTREVMPPIAILSGGWGEIHPAVGYSGSCPPSTTWTTATALHEVIDFQQVEVGNFATEAIPTTTAVQTRAGDLLWIADGAGAVDRGQLSLYLKLVPKGNATDYGAPMYLWSIDSGNYVAFNPATQQVAVAVGGGLPLQSLPIEGDGGDAGPPALFAAGSTVEWFLRAGAGTVLVEYRVNGGPVSTLLQGNLSGNVAPSSPDGGSVPVDLLSRVDPDTGNPAGQFSSWLTTVAVYAQGAAPPGF